MHGGTFSATFLCYSQVLITVPLRALLDQFSLDFPSFCKVGMGHNKKIDFDAKGFIAVTDSVHLLKKLKFDAIFVDEAHHPLPSGMPRSTELYRLSATHKDEPDFRYTMGQAIEDGVLCDYDITVPALTAHHAYVCLADLLLKQAGRFRRVLAYCNSVAEAKRFRMVLRELGLAVWHINGKTPSNKRQAVIAEFAGPLQKPVHVLVTVEVLGEGINIPNADTCMFVEPRNSYRSIIQAIGRVLRHHPAKTLAHIVLPAVAIPKQKKLQEDEDKFPRSMLQSDSKTPAVAPARAGEVGQAENARHERKMRKQAQLRGSVDEGQDGRLQPERAGCRSKAHGCDIDEPIETSSLDWQDKEAPNRAGKLDDPPTSLPKNDFQQSRQQKGNHVKVNRDSQTNSKRQDDESGTQDLTLQNLLGMLAEENNKQPKMKNCQHIKLDSVTEKHRAEFRGLATLTNSTGFLPQNSEGLLHIPSLQTGRRMFGNISQDKLRQVRFNSNSFGLSLDDEYDSQVERFLAMLVQADDRLVGTAASYRLQITDCRVEVVGEVEFKAIHSDIFGRLSAVLHRTDPWEICFKKLEEFCHRHERLPSRTAARSFEEKKLGTWLANQNVMLKSKRLSVQRLNRFLNSSWFPIRERLQGWVSGDRDGSFGKRCVELKQYLAMHETLPLGKHPLANWLYRQRATGLTYDPARKKMLQNLHPLVRDLLKQWERAPMQIKVRQWEERLYKLNSFTQSYGRLPVQKGSGRAERSMYAWFHLQQQRLKFGVLPVVLAQQLRSCHPLIAALARQSEHKAKNKKSRSRKLVWQRFFFNLWGVASQRLAWTHDFYMF